MRTPLSLCLLGALTLLGSAGARAQPGATPSTPTTPTTDAPAPATPSPAAEAPPPAAPTPAAAAATAAAPNVKAPTAEEVQQAREDIDAAMTAQGREDYDKAIVLYRRAYHVLPHPLVLFNAAQSYRLSGRAGRALVLFRRYLAVAPNGPQAPFARQLVDKYVLYAVDPIEDPAFADPTAPPGPVAPPTHNTEAQNFWKWSLIGTAGAAALTTAYFVYAKHEVNLHAKRGQVRGDQPFDVNCPDGMTRTPGFQRACTYQQRANIALYTLIGLSTLSLGSLIMWVHSGGGDHPNEYNKQAIAVAPVVTSSGGGATVSLTW